jgi:hypothetical protein
VPFGLVCDPPGHDYYERDVAYLLELLKAERRANAHAIAELCGQVNSLRDCGQDRVCATPPGCCRHWEERNRELVGQLENALDASNEGAWMARALDAERELAAGRSEADRLTTSLRLANEAPVGDLMTRHTLNIDGWNLEYNDYEQLVDATRISAEKGDVDVDVNDGQLCIEWTEPDDAHYGTMARSVRVPVAVLEQLLEWRRGDGQR